MSSAASGGYGRNIKSVEPRTFTVAMEQLQESYVSAVAATAGCTSEPKRRDVHGFDMEITRPAVSPAQETALLLQLKSTTTMKPDPAKESFGYQFKKRQYFDRLAATRRDPKAILVVMACPQTQKDWTICDHDELRLRYCCYWVYLEGEVVAPTVQAPTVQVPTANVFDAAALRTIMKKLDEGVSLRD